MECVSNYISACSTKAERQLFSKTVSSTSGLMDSLCQPGEFQDREYRPGGFQEPEHTPKGFWDHGYGPERFQDRKYGSGGVQDREFEPGATRGVVIPSRAQGVVWGQAPCPCVSWPWSPAVCLPGSQQYTSVCLQSVPRLGWVGLGLVRLVRLG